MEKIKAVYIGSKKFYRPDWDWSIETKEAIDLIINGLSQVEVIPDSFPEDFGKSDRHAVVIINPSIKIHIEGLPEENKYSISFWKENAYPIWISVSKREYPALFDYIRSLHINECEGSWK